MMDNDDDKGYCSVYSSDINPVNYVSAEEEDFSTIPECAGLSRNEWYGKTVVLVDGHGRRIATAFVNAIDSGKSINGITEMGNDFVGVVITEILVSNVDCSTLNSLRQWSIYNVLYQGISLYDHYRRFTSNGREKKKTSGNKTSARKYDSSRMRSQTVRLKKKDFLVTGQSIREVATKQCCSRLCIQLYTVEMIHNIRHEFHHSTAFKTKMSKKLDVHKGPQYCQNSNKKLIILEGYTICFKAWILVMGVSRADYYRYRSAASNNVRAQEHGNTGRVRRSAAAAQVHETLKLILPLKADAMPHRSRTLPSGEKVVEKVLQMGTQWNIIQQEVNERNVLLNLKPISMLQFSKIRTANFSEYCIKKRGDNFARCGKCDNLLKLRNVHPHHSHAWEINNEKYKSHIREQEAAKAVYYASRALSYHKPQHVLSIMHDKMDHSKTASPCFAEKTKAIDGMMKLPITVTGILAHGHGDGKYAHYSLDVYPADSNHTIGSIAKLLRDLENVPKNSNHSSLFIGAGPTDLYKAVLAGSEMCVTSLQCNPAVAHDVQPLPSILHVQLDNCWKDNKSRFVKCFWSMLVAKGIFTEIQISFMIVGHTHDDIDASFGRWSMKICEHDYPTVPLLMKSYMDLETNPVVPHLIEEVPDFKKFIREFIADGEDILVGHSRGRQFRFYMGEDGWPLMQYKIKCTDIAWSPANGIKLWKQDGSGKPCLPEGVPNAVVPQTMKSHNDIVKGINGFIEHWKKLSISDNTRTYYHTHAHLISYWSGVKAALANKEMEYSDIILQGFWPRTRQANIERTVEATNLVQDFDARTEYIGPRRGRPLPAFQVMKDCHEGYFLLCKPATNAKEPVWLGLVVSGPDVVHGSVHHLEIQTKWYTPVKKSGHINYPYLGWDIVPRFLWMPDDNFSQPTWLHSSTVLTAWQPRGLQIEEVSIPSNHICKALQRLVESI